MKKKAAEKKIANRPSPTETQKAEYCRSVKVLGNNELDYRLSVIITRTREQFLREGDLLAEVHAIRDERKTLMMQRAVITEILEGRR